MGIGLVEETVTAEVAEDAALQDVFECPDVVCTQLGGLVEPFSMPWATPGPPAR